MLGVSEDEYLRMQREMFFDKKFAASLEGAGSDTSAAKASADALSMASLSSSRVSAPGPSDGARVAGPSVALAFCLAAASSMFNGPDVAWWAQLRGFFSATKGYDIRVPGSLPSPPRNQASTQNTAQSMDPPSPPPRSQASRQKTAQANL